MDNKWEGGRRAAPEGWRARPQQVDTWLESLKTIAEEVTERADLSDADAEALIEEALRETQPEI